MKSSKQKISIESYFDFIHSSKQIDLTSSFLHQIISMHGFKRTRHVTKKGLKEAVDAMELINISRSTLRENGIKSSCAFIDVEQVIVDLKDIDWQDCRITSIQTLSSSACESRSDEAAPANVVAGSVVKGGKKRKKGSTTSLARGGSSSSCS